MNIFKRKVLVFTLLLLVFSIFINIYVIEDFSLVNQISMKINYDSNNDIERNYVKILEDNNSFKYVEDPAFEFDIKEKDGYITLSDKNYKNDSWGTGIFVNFYTKLYNGGLKEERNRMSKRQINKIFPINNEELVLENVYDELSQLENFYDYKINHRNNGELSFILKIYMIMLLFIVPLVLKELYYNLRGNNGFLKKVKISKNKWKFSGILFGNIIFIFLISSFFLFMTLSLKFPYLSLLEKLYYCSFLLVYILILVLIDSFIYKLVKNDGYKNFVILMVNLSLGYFGGLLLPINFMNDKLETLGKVLPIYHLHNLINFRIMEVEVHYYIPDFLYLIIFILLMLLVNVVINKVKDN